MKNTLLALSIAILAPVIFFNLATKEMDRRLVDGNINEQLMKMCSENGFSINWTVYFSTTTKATIGSLEEATTTQGVIICEPKPEIKSDEEPKHQIIPFHIINQKDLEGFITRKLNI